MESTCGGVNAFEVYNDSGNENNGSKGHGKGKGVRVWQDRVLFPFSAGQDFDIQRSLHHQSR